VVRLSAPLRVTRPTRGAAVDRSAARPLPLDKDPGRVGRAVQPVGPTGLTRSGTRSHGPGGRAMAPRHDPGARTQGEPSTLRPRSATSRPHASRRWRLVTPNAPPAGTLPGPCERYGWLVPAPCVRSSYPSAAGIAAQNVSAPASVDSVRLNAPFEMKTGARWWSNRRLAGNGCTEAVVAASNQTTCDCRGYPE
jgi:hypothetical protein